MVNLLRSNLLSNEQRGGNTAFLLRLLRDFFPSEHLAIAISGGLDSMALLHAAWSIARERNVRLTALHVHHGLQAAADDWLQHVEQFCRHHKIDCLVRYLDAKTRKNAQSIEDWARCGRYAALAQMASECGATRVWLAQHEDDQIETYLLQKNRGAGARGLSAMPISFLRHGLLWQRPWLTASRAHLAHYVAEQQIDYVHDSSNDDMRFVRNALRLKVRQMNADGRAQVLNAIICAQQQSMQEFCWAQPILETHQIEYRAELGECGRLQQLDLSIFSEIQQAVLLRSWFGKMGWRMPSRVALSELRKQLLSPRIDKNMCWRHADGFAVTHFKGIIIAARLLPMGEWFLTDELMQWCKEEGLTLRARAGGERVRLHSQGPHKSLKNAYQEKGVAPMLRTQLPLVYRGEKLVYIAGVGRNYPD